MQPIIPLDRTQAPPQHPIEEIRLPKPKQIILHNGIPCHIIQNSNLDLIHLMLQIEVGVLHEHKKHIARYCFGLLKESAQSHNATEIAELLNYYGTRYSINETFDNTSICIIAPKKNLSKVLSIICDFLIHPIFREENLTLYKQVKIKDLEYNIQKADFRNTQLLLQAMFGNERTAGQFATINTHQAITLSDLTDFHQKTFFAENMQLYVTGNITDDIEACISQHFSQIPHGKKTPPILDLKMPEDPREVIFEKMEHAVQSSISLCFPSMGYLDDDRADFSILSDILGGYFGSRLMQHLREDKGYTYGVSAGSIYFGNQSLFTINSEVNVHDTQAAIDACLYEMEKLCYEPVSNEELEIVKSYLNGSLLRSVENSVSYWRTFAFWKHFGLNEDEFVTNLHHTRTIDAARIQTLAQKYFKNNKITQIIVGEI